MRFIPAETGEEQQLELLKAQKQEVLESYAMKVASLVFEIKALEFKKSKLEDVVNKAFKQKEDSLALQQIEIDKKLGEINVVEGNNRMIGHELIRRAKMVDNLENEVNNKNILHAEVVAKYNSEIKVRLEEISKKEADIFDKTQKATSLINLANEKITIAENKEKSIDERSIKLVHIINNANEMLQKQKDIQYQNENTLITINLLRKQLQEDRDLFDIEKNENKRTIEMIKTESKRIETLKTDIDIREGNIRTQLIALNVEKQNIIDKQNSIKYDENKLTELKNNVETLIKSRNL